MVSRIEDFTINTSNTSPKRKRVSLLRAASPYSLACASGLYLAIVLAIATPADADVIWLVGQQQPVYGIVDSVGQKQINFRQTTDGQTFQSRKINRRSIATVVINYDASRLSSLAYGDWKPWLELAEELDSQKQDPVARNLAIRLLVIITANSGNLDQRRNAMDSLVSLARNKTEQKQFNRLRFLETGRGDLEVAEESQQADPQARKAAADLVRRVRLQQINQRELAKRVPEMDVISSLEGVCSWQELLQISQSNRIDSRNLRRLVELELTLRSDKKSSVADSQNDWHVLARQIGTSQLTLPSIDNVTEFDPAATKFVDGKWTKP